jgi:hypothetical protein
MVLHRVREVRLLVIKAGAAVQQMASDGCVSSFQRRTTELRMFAPIIDLVKDVLTLIARGYHLSQRLSPCRATAAILLDAMCSPRLRGDVGVRGSACPDITDAGVNMQALANCTSGQ